MFENFPYVNLHNLNLDWILKVVKKNDESVDSLDARVTELEAKTSGEVTKAYVDNQDAETLNTAKGYTDTAIVRTDAFVVEKATEALNEANSFTRQAVPDGGRQGQVLTKRSSQNQDTTWSDATGVPAGGTTGQALVKQSDASGDVAWATVGGGGGTVPESRLIPAGGTAGQALVKTSAVDYELAWENVEGALPEGGTTGQALVKKSNTSGDVEWATVSGGSGVPAGGLRGKVLGKLSNADYNVGWLDAVQWDSQTPYAADTYCTHKGNIWTNISGTSSVNVEPGTDYNVWAVPYHNPNVLDNGWFRIKQRVGISSIGTGYFFDRWTQDSGKVEFLGIGEGATLTNATNFRQLIENDRLHVGVKYTLSCIADGVVYAKTFMLSGAQDQTETFTAGPFTVSFIYNLSGAGLTHIRFSGSGVLNAVKLEEGSISTLQGDEAPNDELELLKCQKYFYSLKSTGSEDSNLGIGVVITGSGKSETCISLSVPRFRTKPALYTVGNFRTWALNDGTVSSIRLGAYTDNVAQLVATSTPLNGTCAFFNGTNARIELSADL